MSTIFGGRDSAAARDGPQTMLSAAMIRNVRMFHTPLPLSLLFLCATFLCATFLCATAALREILTCTRRDNVHKTSLSARRPGQQPVGL